MVILTEIMEVKTPKCHTVWIQEDRLTISYNSSHLWSTYNGLDAAISAQQISAHFNLREAHFMDWETETTLVACAKG